MSARIQFLIDNLHEGLDVEVKNWLGGLATNEEKAKLAKEIIALANNGGGHVFIGFDDEGEGHPEIPAQEGELDGFTPDAIASLVHRYVQPPCQCQLGFYSREGSEDRHPVITVPGGHRTPLWAARSSPDQQTLVTDSIYVRRPGGFSERARNQDDWEKLLERLLRARQGEQLDAIREIMNPTDRITRPVEGLSEWVDVSLAGWRELVDPLQNGDVRKLESGYWLFAFEIEPVTEPPLRELNQFLEREVRKYSGWPPFTYLHHDPSRPQAQGDTISAWLARNHGAELVSDDQHCDFWRLSRSGKGFILRPMQEDHDSYLANRFPRPETPSFDWTLPIYRSVELLKFIQEFAERFADQNVSFRVLLRYEGTNGRQLQQHNFQYNLRTGQRSNVDSIEATLEGTVYEIENNLEETIFQLLSPVFEQFEFSELPMALVNNVTREALGNQR